MMENWNKWKNFLGKAVDIGETVGMSEETITNIASKIGTYLSNNVEPRNQEEKLLKELWDVADDYDKKVLAKLIVKISDK